MYLRTSLCRGKMFKILKIFVCITIFWSYIQGDDPLSTRKTTCSGGIDIPEQQQQRYISNLTEDTGCKQIRTNSAMISPDKNSVCFNFLCLLPPHKECYVEYTGTENGVKTVKHCRKIKNCN